MAFFKGFIKKKKNEGGYYYLPSNKICFSELENSDQLTKNDRKLPFSDDLRQLVDKVLRIKPENRQAKIIIEGDVAWVPGIGLILAERGNWENEIRENWICIRETMYPRFIELGLFPDYREPDINSYEIIVYESLYDTKELAEKAQESVLGSLSYAEKKKLMEAVLVFQPYIEAQIRPKKKKTQIINHTDRTQSILCNWGRSAYRFSGDITFNQSFSMILTKILSSDTLPQIETGTIKNTRWWIRQPVINLILEIVEPEENNDEDDF